MKPFLITLIAFLPACPNRGDGADGGVFADAAVDGTDPVDHAPSCVPPVPGTPVVYANAALLSKEGAVWKDFLAAFDPVSLKVTEWMSLESCHSTAFANASLAVAVVTDSA